MQCASSNKAQLSRSVFAVDIRMTPLVRDTVLGGLAEPPTYGEFIRADASPRDAYRHDARYV